MIKKYTKKNGITAYMFVAYLGTDPATGKQKRTTRRGFETYKEARIAESRLLASLEEEKLNEGKYKFKDVYDSWIEEYKEHVKISSFNHTLNRARIHILPIFGDFYIDKIDAVMCRDVVSAWAKKYESASLMKIVTQQIFDHAILLKLIKENPMRIIKMPKKLVLNNDTGKFYDKEELQLFFKAANEHGDELWETFFRLLAMTGMRKGEALALCWNDIDFKEKTINITKGVTLDENRQTFISTPKTESSIRIISADPNTLHHLQKWKINQARYFLQSGIIVNKSNQHIFTNVRNELFHPPAPNIVLDDIIPSGQLKRITVHGFRHTHASLLFEIDTPIQVVQERLGHKEIATTKNIYAHVTVKNLCPSIEKVEVFCLIIIDLQ